MSINRMITLDQQTDTVQELIEELKNDGVKFVRLTYSDMHGYPRGKDIPLDYFANVVSDGQNFCIANLVDGLDGNPLFAPGMAPDRGFPDMRAIPDLSTLSSIPWEPHTVQCLADLYEQTGEEIAISPRQFLKNAVRLFEKELQLQPIFAHELEFYLLKHDQDGWKKYSDHPAQVYTVGKRSDELGMMHSFLEAGKEMGLKLTAANHEIGGGQFEVNMLHGKAIEAADRAFRFKNMIKEVAASKGLHATFMGKPFNEDTGSGFHVHVSLIDQNEQNIFNDPNEEDGLSQTFRHFLAGILHHAPSIMIFLAPTINAYKRLVPDSLVPIASTWGYDNRTAYARIPSERGKGTRIELRVGDASANPYLISAAFLYAGYDGIVNQLDLPAPVFGEEIGDAPSLPTSLAESIQVLQANKRICELIGEPMVNAFTAMKQVECTRFERYVTDWEFNEYVYHL